MKILIKYEELIGKTISFVHAGRYAKVITIATTDKEVIFFEPTIDDLEEDGIQIQTYGEGMALHYIRSDEGRYVREKLGKYGVFDLEEYNRQKKVEREEQEKKWAIEKEQRERAEFERLSKKFGEK